MIEHATATVVDGALALDRPIDIPNNTRVLVTVPSMSDSSPTAGANAGWASWKQRIKAHPVHAAGRRYSRDELHERG